MLTTDALVQTNYWKNLSFGFILRNSETLLVAMSINRGGEVVYYYPSQLFGVQVVLLYLNWLVKASSSFLS